MLFSTPKNVDVSVTLKQLEKQMLAQLLPKVRILDGIEGASGAYGISPPAGEAWLMQDGRVVAKIVNLG